MLPYTLVRWILEQRCYQKSKNPRTKTRAQSNRLVTRTAQCPCRYYSTTKSLQCRLLWWWWWWDQIIARVRSLWRPWRLSCEKPDVTKPVGGARGIPKVQPLFYICPVLRNATKACVNGSVVRRQRRRASAVRQPPSIRSSK